jgi:hypothetical protein
VFSGFAVDACDEGARAGGAKVFEEVFGVTQTGVGDEAEDAEEGDGFGGGGHDRDLVVGHGEGSKDGTLKRELREAIFRR